MAKVIDMKEYRDRKGSRFVPEGSYDWQEERKATIVRAGKYAAVVIGIIAAFLSYDKPLQAVAAAGLAALVWGGFIWWLITKWDRLEASDLDINDVFQRDDNFDVEEGFIVTRDFLLHSDL